MDDAQVRVTCFGVGKRTKATDSRKKDATRNRKDIHPLSISPLSSINSDEAIKAHRSLLEEAALANHPQQVEVLTELAQERAQRQMLEEQLVSALNINAEMKLALSLQDEETERNTFIHRLNKVKSQLRKERKERAEMEMQLSASKREAAAMRAALNAARTQRDDLEAELMEAALDVMDNEKQRATLHATMKHEKQMMQLAESAMTENENLRAKLRDAESARDALEQRLQAMSLEASDWEAALDGLQDQLEMALLNRPLESIVVDCAPRTPPKGGQPGAQSFLVQPPGESCVNAEVRINGGLKASKEEPWRQVVLNRPAVLA